MSNTWPGGKRHAMAQDAHEKWNATHYPGTRQLCDACDQPTGQCEEDAYWSGTGNPLCRECYLLETTESGADIDAARRAGEGE